MHDNWPAFWLRRNKTRLVHLASLDHLYVMKNLTFPAVISTLEVFDSDVRIPVRRIFCVGRNYAAHAREMGNNERDPPFFFTKPADSIVKTGTTLPYPPQTNDLHHEAELVVVVSNGGANIKLEDAKNYIFGFAAGNDLTRRDLQTIAKAQKRPWDMSKAFDNSAIIGQVHRGCEIASTAGIRCFVNESLRQSSTLDKMMWSTEEIIVALSATVELAQGDVIMTGTPEGVGPVAPGEQCRVEIDSLTPATFDFAL